MLAAVAKSLAKAQPRGVAKYSGMGEAWLSEFAKYFASLSESEFLDLVEKVKRKGARHFPMWRGRPFLRWVLQVVSRTSTGVCCSSAGATSLRLKIQNIKIKVRAGYVESNE